MDSQGFLGPGILESMVFAHTGVPTPWPCPCVQNPTETAMLPLGPKNRMSSFEVNIPFL